MSFVKSLYLVGHSSSTTTSVVFSLRSSETSLADELDPCKQPIITSSVSVRGCLNEIYAFPEDDTSDAALAELVEYSSDTAIDLPVLLFVQLLF